MDHVDAVRSFAKTLNNLEQWMQKAADHAKARSFEVDVLAQARLAPDQFDFTRQVQSACDAAKGAVARLAGVEIPKHEDTEQTLAELKARIAKTIDFIDSVKAGQIDGSEDRPIVLKIRGQEVKYTGMQYLLGFAHPNFYFHVTTAYDILRHNGVEVGKRDFIGNP